MNPYQYDRYEKLRPPGYVKTRSAIREITGLIGFIVIGALLAYGFLAIGEDYCGSATPTYRSACLYRTVGGMDDVFRQPVRAAR